VPVQWFAGRVYKVRVKCGWQVLCGEFVGIVVWEGGVERWRKM
jgi:hypothetical protein